MSCLELSITPVAPPVLTIASVGGAGVSIEPAAPATTTVTPVEPAQLDIQLSSQASVSITPTGGVSFAIGDVCSVTGGTLYVLAASDGPLRTRDGGYLLLKPPATTAGS